MGVSRLLVAIFLQLLSARSVKAKTTRNGSTCYDSNGNIVACPVNKTAIIAGVVVGAVALILAITFCVVILHRKRGKAKALALQVLPSHISSKEKFHLPHAEPADIYPAVGKQFGPQQSPPTVGQAETSVVEPQYHQSPAVTAPGTYMNSSRPRPV